MSDSVLKAFPKERIILPKAYQDIYNLHYQRNREGKTKATSLSMQLEQWLHKQVAKDVQNIGKDTLEIGAGTFNQLEYEPKVGNYDVVEPFTELFKNSPNKSRVRNIYKDILEVDAKKKYPRITSVATFEHISDLPVVVAKAALLLEKGGELRTSIPNEGTIMWKLGSMITGFEFKKMYGLDYSVLMQHEHINTAREIESVLKYFFRETKLKYFGLNKYLAFYVFIENKEPDVERAKAYLKSRNIE